MYVFDTDLECLCSISRIVRFTQKEKVDQMARVENKKQRAYSGKYYIKYELKTEGIAYAFRIALAFVLGSKDTDSGSGSEDNEKEDEHKLVGDSDTGNRVSANASDHEIVQKVYEVRNTVLHHHRDGDLKKRLNIGSVVL